ncbi:GNAT family N-acetyltransferase [Plantactinospora siamensis]|uniref:GNAT family N-acetyltransferase n=1 Tax=Plantactinospora siamensis TaxID=555372 RepID=A0ABV6NVI8_9ACTN
MTISLTPMTQAELDRRLREAVEHYAQAIAEARGLPLAEAMAESDEQHRLALPDGVRSPGMLLFTGRTAAGEEVGWLWLALPGDRAGGPERGWVYDIEVAAEQRGKGYGRGLMLAAEHELAGRGVGALGLNVHGYNTTAMRLYDSLGFEITAQQLVKPLGGAGPAGSDRSPVSLAPMPADELARRLPLWTEEHARAEAASRGIPLDQARERAAERIRKDLPDGVSSPDALLRRVCGADGGTVGWAWVRLRGDGPGRAALHHLEIDPGHRRRGYGRAAALLIERELAARGVPELEVNVFAGNAAARGLFPGLGYAVAGQQMVKPLRPRERDVR